MKMNCRTAEEMVNRYMNHTLSVEETEEFLNHIQKCSSCYDELETYFIVHEALQQLAEDEGETALDFRKLLGQDIRRARRHIRTVKAKRFLGEFAVLLFLAFLAGFLLFVMMEAGGYL